MQLAADLAAAFVALLHFAFFALQSFLWTKPTGRKVFGRTVEQAEASAQLAVNQGIYNAFVGVGLVWTLVRTGSALDAPGGDSEAFHPVRAGHARGDRPRAALRLALIC
jgi:putative membrane protein